MESIAELVDAGTVIPRKVWTREEAHLLVDLGFPNAEKLELINGELIEGFGKNHPHVLWENLTLAWLHAIFGSEFVRFEAPTDVSAEDNPTNEPEPDLVVTKKSIREYTTTPSPTDLQLVIEISDSTVKFDRSVKADLYARAKIVEYWMIDIPGNQVLVHRDPRDGKYQTVMSARSDETISPLAKPDALFCMDRL